VSLPKTCLRNVGVFVAAVALTAAVTALALWGAVGALLPWQGRARERAD
jgi:hypothetical protein